MMMTPFDDYSYLITIINRILLGESPTIEECILLAGTVVALVAFILWCCFPVIPRVMPVDPINEDNDFEYCYFERKTEHCS